MQAHIYNTDTNEIVAVIIGNDNQSIEAKANELGYMGVDEYGLCYEGTHGLTMSDDAIWYTI